MMCVLFLFFYYYWARCCTHLNSLSLRVMLTSDYLFNSGPHWEMLKSLWSDLALITPYQSAVHHSLWWRMSIGVIGVAMLLLSHLWMVRRLHGTNPGWTQCNNEWRERCMRSVEVRKLFLHLVESAQRKSKKNRWFYGVRDSSGPPWSEVGFLTVDGFLALYFYSESC